MVWWLVAQWADTACATAVSSWLRSGNRTLKVVVAAPVARRWAATTSGESIPPLSSAATGTSATARPATAPRSRRSTSRPASSRGPAAAAPGSIRGPARLGEEVAPPRGGGGGGEGAPPPLQRRPERAVVVDLPVVGDPDAPVLVAHRLVAGRREVDQREPAVDQRAPVVPIRPPAVR